MGYARAAVTPVSKPSANDKSAFWPVLGFAVVFAIATAPEAIGLIVFIAIIAAVIYGFMKAGTGFHPDLARTGRRTQVEVISVQRSADPQDRTAKMTLKLSAPGLPARTVTISRDMTGFVLPSAGDVLTAFVDKKQPWRFHVELPVVRQAEVAAAPAAAPTTRSDAVSRIIEAVDATGFDFARRGSDARGKIERFQPLPDGAYEMVLHVTPRDRDSYHVRLETFVPADDVPRLRIGASLRLRVDPDRPGRLVILGR